MKKVRTIRIDKGVSDNLDFICNRHGDVSWHIEQALNGYPPIRQLTPQSSIETPEPKGISPVPIDRGLVKLGLEFDAVWAIYERKGNRKTSKARYLKLSESDRDAIFKHAPIYVKATPDKQFRKDFQSYINLEAWNDEVITNAENKPNQNTDGYRLSTVEQVRATNEANRAARAGNRDGMGDANGCLRKHPGQTVRKSDAGGMDSIIEGDYTESN